MTRIIRSSLATLTATAGALVLAATPVAAAAPPNDAFAAAEQLTLAAPVVADTTEATVEELDLEATGTCPEPPGTPPFTTNTAWYVWDSGADPPPTVAVLTSESSFPAGIAVVTGEPGSFTTLACGLTAVIFDAEPGVTYHVMLFDPFDTGGGVTTLVLDEARPPTIELTVATVGRFDPETGTATISGDYRCSDASFAFAFGSLKQNVGRFTIVGFFDVELICDGATHDWAAVATSETGRFGGGKATASINVFACSPITCVDQTVEQTVSLRGGGS